MAYKIDTQKDGVATPMFEIWLDEEELTDTHYRMVEEITYESTISGADTAKIRIKDPHMQLMNDPRLVRGKKLRLYGGWKYDLQLWLQGYIGMVDIEYPNTGVPVITLHGMDESYLLDRFEVKRSYSNVTFEEVAGVIGDLYGLTTEGEVTEKQHDNISQTNETDIKFLTRLAEEENLIVLVEKGTIKWFDKDRMQKQEPQDTFVWRKKDFSLENFRPRVVVADRKDAVQKEEVNLDNNEIEEGQADDSTDREQMGEDSTVFNGFHYDGGKSQWLYEGE